MSSTHADNPPAILPPEELETETWFSRGLVTERQRHDQLPPERAGIVLAVPADDGGMECLTLLTGRPPNHFSDVVLWPGRSSMRCLVFRFMETGQTELLGEVLMTSEAERGRTWLHVQARWDGSRVGVSISHLGTGEVGRARFRLES